MFGKLDNKTFCVEGMMCEHCKKKVEETALSLKGVKSASVDLESKTLSVSYSPKKIEIEDIMLSIKEAGFEVK